MRRADVGCTQTRGTLVREVPWNWVPVRNSDWSDAKAHGWGSLRQSSVSQSLGQSLAPLYSRELRSAHACLRLPAAQQLRQSASA